MGHLSKGIGNAIGVTKEYLADRERRSQDKQTVATSYEQPEQSQDSDDSSTDEEDLAIELDEVQESASTSVLTADETRDVDTTLETFSQRHPLPPYPKQIARLALPVFLPQRRPVHNPRGFIRAYAPVLEACDIDQSTWLDFLDGFGRAIKYMSPVFHVVNLAIVGTAIALNAVSVLSLTARAVTFALLTSAELARRGYIHYETNKYLDSMNDQPRRLCCMIMDCKPRSADVVETVDIAQNTAKAVASRDTGHRSKLRLSNGTTRIELEIPEAASLVFPELDSMSAGEKKNASKEAGTFLAEYFDRRAQANFGQGNPNSKLNISAPEQKQFVSRYCDPTHPANSGNLVALVIGGAVDTK